MNVLAIVPARGGSKRLPNKNIINLCGKPLIVHTLDNAKKSKLITKLVVSTDSKDIANISKKYCQVIMRPKELATDTASTYDVIFHALDYLKKNGEEYDYVVLLEPTSPLRRNYDIDSALQILRVFSNEDAIISVGEVHLEKSKLQLNLNRLNLRWVSKYKGITYFPYGVVYISKVSTLRKKKTFYHDKTIPYFIERWQNYEIDDLYDLKCVEAIMKWVRKNGR